MSKVIWKKSLGGSLTVFQQERSQFIQVRFYVSPHYSSNGMYNKSLRPITKRLEGIKMAKKIYREFPFQKYQSNPSSTTFHDEAVKAYKTRKKDYRIKESHKIKENPKYVTTAEKEWQRYLKEMKSDFGNIEMNNRDAIENAKYDLVDRLKTFGNLEGKKLEDNTIRKYLNIIGVVEKRGIADGLLTSQIKNPPTERRSNARPAYRMLELKKITDEIMEEFRRTEDLFYLEMHDYVQFGIASPTRLGLETMSLQMSDLKLLHNKDKVKILRVRPKHTKTGEFGYITSPEFLKFYSQRILDRFETLSDDDYFWFPKSDKTRGTLQQRVSKNFCRISNSLGLYYFNGKERPLTSIRHASYQRMKREGVVDLYEVAKIHNTSLEMGDKHYGNESDDRSIIEEHDRIYAKRLKQRQ